MLFLNPSMTTMTVLFANDKTFHLLNDLFPQHLLSFNISQTTFLTLCLSQFSHLITFISDTFNEPYWPVPLSHNWALSLLIFDFVYKQSFLISIFCTHTYKLTLYIYYTLYMSSYINKVFVYYISVFVKFFPAYLLYINLLYLSCYFFKAVTCPKHAYISGLDNFFKKKTKERKDQ